MAKGKGDRARDKEINRKFEEQGRRLQRKWRGNAVKGIVALVLLLIALQFTPYRDVPKDVLEKAIEFFQGLTSGGSGPREPDPKYW